MFSSGLIIILIWVDDLVIAASNMSLMKTIKGALKDTFRMKDLGQLTWFLGIKFAQGPGYLTMSQRDYLKSKIDKFGLSTAKPRSTPCETAGYTVHEDAECTTQYREMVGSIIYAMTCTRPDLAWVVTKLSQHLNNPTAVDTVMLKHVFRYLLGTLDYKLTFTKSEGGGLELFGFSDADWGASTEDRKSISGYYFALNKNGPAISWKSKRQSTVALSSCESEYIALTYATQEALYLSQLLNDLLHDLLPSKSFNPITINSSGVKINADNQGALKLSRNPVHHNRSKHFDIKYHFIRDSIATKKIDAVYVPSEENIADLMTKPFSKVKLRKFEEVLFGKKVSKT